MPPPPPPPSPLDPSQLCPEYDVVFQSNDAPPPPPPPPSQTTVFFASKPSPFCRVIQTTELQNLPIFLGQIDDVVLNPLQLTKDNELEVPLGLYHVFFERLPLHWSDKGTTTMSLLELASAVCFHKKHNKGVGGLIGRKIFPAIQALAAPDEEDTSLIRYWDHNITTLLDKPVVITAGGTSFSGTLLGSVNQPDECDHQLEPNVYTMRISGSPPSNVKIDLRDFTRPGHSIRLGLKSLDEPKNENAAGEEFENV